MKAACITSSFAHAVMFVGTGTRSKMDLASRLHKKKCVKAVEHSMTNPELRPTQRECESNLQAAGAYVEKRRDVARRDER